MPKQRRPNLVHIKRQRVRPRPREQARVQADE